MAKPIVLGSGDLYTMAYAAGTEVPDSATIETEANRLGHIQGGATLEYTPTFYTAKDDFGRVTKTIITEEAVKLKSGVITWDISVLENISNTSVVITDSTNRKKTMKLGGSGRYDGLARVFHFVHKDKVDGDLRVTVVGTNQAGFSLAFVKDKETIVNIEIVAQPMDADGTLVVLEETTK